jgi:hypothetical protein
VASQRQGSIILVAVVAAVTSLFLHHSLEVTSRLVDLEDLV